jgi:hypothetical protein
MIATSAVLRGPAPGVFRDPHRKSKNLILKRFPVL